MTHTNSVEAITQEAVFIHQAFQRAKPHDYHKPFEELDQEYQRVMKSIASEIIARNQQQVEEAVTDIIKMADALEIECGKDGDKGTKQWMAFKGFRNTIRDKYLTPNHQD